MALARLYLDGEATPKDPSTARIYLAEIIGSNQQGFEALKSQARDLYRQT